MRFDPGLKVLLCFDVTKSLKEVEDKMKWLSAQAA